MVAMGNDETLILSVRSLMHHVGHRKVGDEGETHVNIDIHHESLRRDSRSDHSKLHPVSKLLPTFLEKASM